MAMAEKLPKSKLVASGSKKPIVQVADSLKTGERSGSDSSTQQHYPTNPNKCPVCHLGFDTDLIMREHFRNAHRLQFIEKYGFEEYKKFGNDGKLTPLVNARHTNGPVALKGKTTRAAPKPALPSRIVTTNSQISTSPYEDYSSYEPDCCGCNNDLVTDDECS